MEPFRRENRGNMRFSMKSKLILCTSALALMIAAPVAEVKAWHWEHGAGETVLFSGGDIKEDSWFAYVGAVHALNGLSADGFAVKAFVGGGEFDYDATGPGIGSIKNDGDSLTFDLLAGYRMHFDGMQVGIYGGVNYWDIDHDNFFVFGPVTPNVKANGDKFGAKIEAELSSTGPGPVYFDVRGSYSTAFDTYWSRGRVGYNVGMATIGPEGGLLGNDDYDQQRIGGFVQFDMPNTGVAVSVSVGYADTDGSTGDDSVYGTFNISTVF